ncbi:unnamed protein product [Sphagnum jensenii]|uniref:Uncharacterized protein n=1 Tax=Sphagnum jensenii TaxID=128206 RepID=A0ABP0WP63_9BRYO
MFPAIEQGEQSIGYTRPKTRLAGDAGTVIANNPHDPPYPKWICFDGSFTVPTPHYRSRGDRGIFSRYSATSNISHIHLRPAAFPPPTNPNAQAPAHTALSQVQTQTWCSRWVLQEGSIPDSGHTPASHNETRPKNKGVGNHADHAAPHTGPPLTWIRSWHRDYKHCSYQINTKCDLNIDIPHVYSTVLMTDFLRLKY